MKSVRSLHPAYAICVCPVFAAKCVPVCWYFQRTARARVMISSVAISFIASSSPSYMFYCIRAVLPFVVLCGDRVAFERTMVSFDMYLQCVAVVLGANCFMCWASCNVFVLRSEPCRQSVTCSCVSNYKSWIYLLLKHTLCLKSYLCTSSGASFGEVHLQSGLICMCW